MSAQKLYIKDIMTTEVITVGPEDPALQAAKLIFEYGLNGLPVVDQKGLAVGIITEYDLISRGDFLKLPTLINILANIETYQKDQSLVADDLKKLIITKAKDIMNPEPLTVSEEAPISLLAELFANHHRVNPILVIDRNRQLTGLVSRFDLVRFFVDSKTDYCHLANQPEILNKQVKKFISQFEKKFAVRFNPKRPPHLWIIIGLLLVLLGLAVSFNWILQAVSQW